MANSIQIGAPSGAFERGRTLSVPIVVELDRPTKVRGIRARFRGAEETKAVYTTSSTDSDGRTTTQTHTAVETTEFVSRDYLLQGGERLGFFGSMKDGMATMLGGGRHELMPPGSYPFTIEFAVPSDGRATHAGKKSRVYYEISAQVDIPLATDLTALYEFQLTPLPERDLATSPVRACYPDEETGKRGLMDSMFGPNVQMEVALQADRYRVGDTIEGLVGVQTTKPLNCRHVRARLVAVETTKAHSHTDSHHFTESAIEIDSPGEIDGDYTQRFSLPAVIQGPPSAQGERFNVNWFVQVELDFPWSKDPSLRVPIELLPGA
jgi:hypothetical protein